MLVAFVGRTDVFIKYDAILCSVVMENDNHFSEHSATSKYYVILIPVDMEMTIISAKILPSLWICELQSLPNKEN